MSTGTKTVMADHENNAARDSIHRRRSEMPIAGIAIAIVDAAATAISPEILKRRSI